MCRTAMPGMSGKVMSCPECHSLRYRFMKCTVALVLMIGWVVMLYEIILTLNQNKEIPALFSQGITINCHFTFP